MCISLLCNLITFFQTDIILGVISVLSSFSSVPASCHMQPVHNAFIEEPWRLNKQWWQWYYRQAKPLGNDEDNALLRTTVLHSGPFELVCQTVPRHSKPSAVVLPCHSMLSICTVATCWRDNNSIRPFFIYRLGLASPQDWLVNVMTMHLEATKESFLKFLCPTLLCITISC